jgi:hypothetical protein
MSAVGRWVCVADALADGVGETGAGSVAPGPGALAVLFALFALFALLALFAVGVAIPAIGARA